MKIYQIWQKVGASAGLLVETEDREYFYSCALPAWRSSFAAGHELGKMEVAVVFDYGSERARAQDHKVHLNDAQFMLYILVATSGDWPR